MSDTPHVSPATSSGLVTSLANSPCHVTGDTSTPSFSKNDISYLPLVAYSNGPLGSKVLDGKDSSYEEGETVWVGKDVVLMEPDKAIGNVKELTESKAGAKDIQVRSMENGGDSLMVLNCYGEGSKVEKSSLPNNQPKDKVNTTCEKTNKFVILVETSVVEMGEGYTIGECDKVGDKGNMESSRRNQVALEDNFNEKRERVSESCKEERGIEVSKEMTIVSAGDNQEESTPPRGVLTKNLEECEMGQNHQPLFSFRKHVDC
ncbi:hypothetical protein Pint_33393 [Pistacia integerrima]|uniref:Uncharacterized protein n=1 Tax=Pistacia integerrima TaxID=434235 RepID=A0ACC0X602_9ROSI|nr:hypothetical protein Pint_33393 [Pistacia integerrima]